MKSDLTDHKICDTLFNQFDFTDKLIEAHLASHAGEKVKKGSATMLERDAEAYRQFIDSMSKPGDGVVSPYDHFYMKEALKKGNPEEIADKIFKLANEHPPRP